MILTLAGLGLTIVDKTTPSYGTATINSDGTLHYQPTTGFYGIDTFSYTVQSYSGYRSTKATISIVFVNKFWGIVTPNITYNATTLPEGTYASECRRFLTRRFGS